MVDVIGEQARYGNADDDGSKRRSRVARDVTGDEVAWARQNREFLLPLVASLAS